MQPEPLPGLRIERSLGAGPDGTALEAANSAGDSFIIHRLSTAGQNADRMAEIESRVKLLHSQNVSGFLPIHEFALDADPPTVCTAMQRETTLADANDLKELTTSDRIQIAVRLLEILVSAHRLGLTHGNLTPSLIEWRGSDVRVDFLGLRTRSGYGLTESTQEDDVLAVAKILEHLLESNSSNTRPSNTSEVVSERKVTSARQLLSRAALPPNERPLAIELLQSFKQLQVATDNESPSETESQDSVSEPKRGNDRQALDVTQLSQAPTSANVIPDREQTSELNDLAPSDGTAEFSMTDLASTSNETADGRRHLAAGDQLGRFVILEKIGEGGMGAVYKAKDLGDEQLVAIKTLKADSAPMANALVRFQKEGRMLASVNNPFVTNLIEVNEDDGLHYIVLEYVAGIDLKAILAKVRPLPEKQAISIASDIARALVDAHENGIIHRDIKPENVLLSGNPIGQEPTRLEEPIQCKLSDFGLARHVDNSESLAVTQAGTILGTPRYMSPEQCKGTGEVLTQSDVYSLGITLYELLTGEVPFQADDPIKLISMHCFDVAPPVRKCNPEVSEAIEKVVAKALAKDPNDRYADAEQILAEMEAILNGHASNIHMHPVLPPVDKQRDVQIDLEWDLKSSPEELWPFVSNTERLNRAIGLPPVAYRTVHDKSTGMHRFGSFRMAGLSVEWEEHPFEWIEGKRMGVVRDFIKGPFRSLTSVVELERNPHGGSKLRHQIVIVPKGFLGKTLARIDAAFKTPKMLDRVYQRVDAALVRRRQEGPYEDAFEKPERLPRAVRSRIDQRIQRLEADGVAPEIASRLGEFLATAPEQEVAKIQPLVLARQLAIDEQELLSACLKACRTGLLTIAWDVLCPTCRVAADTRATLKEIQEHTLCEACNIDFDSDLPNAVELVFQASSDLRTINVGTFCVGGPAHSPHVVAQVRTEPDEWVELELNLPTGNYLLRGPSLPYTISMRVQASGAPSRCELSLGADFDSRSDVVLRGGKQLMRVANRFGQMQVLRVERTIARQFVITAAQASTIPLFREVFPDEVFAKGRLLNAEHVTLLVTSISDVDEIYERLGDVEAYATIQTLHAETQKIIEEESGPLVKVVGDGVFAAFDDVADAVRAAFRLRAGLKIPTATDALSLCVGVHNGPAIVATANDRLDYFGSTARVATSLPSVAPAGVVLTEAVYADPVVADWLQENSPEGRYEMVDLPTKPKQLVQLF